ncbi:VOC family protein [Aurantimicrobium sp.]|uniref:VOC family protein n=1 Tax=Aurantimicrobium sp. TaxID=1930784 RepID=UPI002FCB2956
MRWFDTQAEEAAEFYVSLFPDASILSVSRGADGNAFTVEFELHGSRYTALNGGPLFSFTEAFSIFVTVDGQDEVDYYWNALTANGGDESRCGWLKDKYGVSWQIVPKQLGEALGSSDPAVSSYAMAAMMKMSKIIVSDLLPS